MTTRAETRAALETELRQLIDDHPDGFTGDVLERFETVEEKLRMLNRQDEALARVRETGKGLESGFHAPTVNVNVPRDPYEPVSGFETANQLQSRATTAIEQWKADGKLRESATQTLYRAGRDAQDGGAQDVRGVSEHILRYSHPDYVGAFRKYATDPESYTAELTAGEARAWRDARAYQRAVLDLGGAVLPSPLDPTIVLTNDGVDSAMRTVARVDTTVSKSKRFITSAGSSFSYDAEAAEVSDDTHTESEVEITTAKAQGWITATIEAAMDQPQFESEVAKLIADGKARLEEQAFITGTGTDAPKGIEVALAGTASEVSAAGEALTADDVYGLIEALPPRFRSRARWQLELSTQNFIHRLYNPTGTEPALIEGQRLLGLPYMLNSSVDPYSAVDAAATASNRVLFIGDWSKYVILDRVGMAVHYIGPGMLRGANDRPDGRVGWYAYWRNGADVLATEPFRMLSVDTTA